MNEQDYTVRELLDRLYAATERMSRKNPHRALLLHSMNALMQLSKRIEEHETRAAEPPRVELVTLQ